MRRARSARRTPILGFLWIFVGLFLHTARGAHQFLEFCRIVFPYNTVKSPKVHEIGAKASWTPVTTIEKGHVVGLPLLPLPDACGRLLRLLELDLAFEGRKKLVFWFFAFFAKFRLASGDPSLGFGAPFWPPKRVVMARGLEKHTKNQKTSKAEPSVQG